MIYDRIVSNRFVRTQNFSRKLDLRLSNCFRFFLPVLLLFLSLFDSKFESVSCNFPHLHVINGQ